jgi:ABC-2 type transport system ATP-binding protein
VSPETSTPLAAENITVRFGARTALAEVSLTVEPGAVFAVLGRNGAGKSSLVQCLLGERRPATGRAVLMGYDAWRDRALALREVGVVPEEATAPPHATARQLARFCSRLYPRWDAEGCARRLNRLGVPVDVPFGRLSKGEKGQVALSLALACQPRLLLLDDPTLGLDPVARREVFSEIIDELADRGTTVFVATHELAAIESIATHVALLDRGRLLLAEPVESLKARFRRIRHCAPKVERAWPRRVMVAGETDGMTTAARAEERVDLGTFSPVETVARPWGTETVVSAFDQERFASLAGSDSGTVATPLTLEDIFLALVGADERSA